MPSAKRLLPLLEFGREREGVDLSGVELTHHKLKELGKRDLPLGVGEPDKLQPLTEPGSGEVQQKEKALLAEIISKVNTLFEGELTDDDKLVYVNHVLKGKLLESEILVQQAANNTKEQFANSPDLSNELMNAILDAFSAHTTMSKQAIDSEKVRSGLKDILLGPAKLYEALREQFAAVREAYPGAYGGLYDSAEMPEPDTKQQPPEPEPVAVEQQGQENSNHQPEVETTDATEPAKAVEPDLYETDQDF